LLELPILRHTNDFAFDSQLLVDAVTTGERVVDVSIPTRYTTDSSSISVGRSMEWAVVPRSFHASYIAGRVTSSHGARGRAAQRLSQVVDPRVPVGWLGDVVLVLARPA
jgi:hypothetical protein